MTRSAGAAIVTGAARGIGFGIAERLAVDGYAVTLGDVSAEEAAQRASALCARGLEADFAELDVTDAAAIHELCEEVSSQRPLRLYVNNAGLRLRKRITDVTPEEYDRVMDVNVRGVFFGIQAAASVMSAGDEPSIVNISSTSGFRASTVPNSVYDTSKGAVRMLTITAARELAPLGIRVNAVAPGTISTEAMWAAAESVQAVEQSIHEWIPLGQLGTVNDVASAVSFLCSDAASYVTGHVLAVDGGWLT